MLYDDSFVYDIAFATYRNINVGTSRRFRDLGVSPRDFSNRKQDGCRQ